MDALVLKPSAAQTGESGEGTCKEL